MATTGLDGDPVGHMYGTIVCGVTETAEARSAAQLAAALAARLGLRLVLVHVACRAELPAPNAATVQAPTAAVRAIAEIAHALGGEVETRVVPGGRADGLARVAADEGADVIVLGSRPRGARGRQLRCTLACELEEATAVPVLIAPPATRRRSTQRLALADAPPAR
jgi:nucleotide-binding universal stress UspA family protein